MESGNNQSNEDVLSVIDATRKKTREMLLSPHDDLGLVLKCHLIAEDSLTRYLKVAKGLKNVENARLSFSQKVDLLDDGDGSVFNSRGGLREINSIRNSFGHNFDASLVIKPNGSIAKSAKAFLESVSRMHRDVLEKFKEACAEPELVETFQNLLNGMREWIPERKGITGENIALLSQEEPRELLAYYVDSFCGSVSIEILRRSKGL